MPATACPPPEHLARLLGPGGSPAEVDALAAHLEQCEACGGRLDALLGNDAVATTLRASGNSTVERSGALDAVRRRLLELRPAVAAARASDETIDRPPDASHAGTDPAQKTEPDLEFLGPPQGPGEIARLGPYRVLRKLGAGGMGMVLLAEDAMLRRKVALKVMLPAVAASPIAKDRFLREARSAARIEHPHIVPIYQVGEDRGVPYLAMPFLKGESLDDRLDREKRLPPAEALRVALEMAEGLAAAHDAGLIHRDIKPGNVWLEGTKGTVKLLDFGLARSATDDAKLTQSGAIVGTPAFMAPEQARGDDVDGRADLFSLGSVLYLSLTGVRPFKGANTMSVLTSLALDSPTPPATLNAQVPLPLSHLVTRLMAKDPAGRPATAREVVAELTAIGTRMALAEAGSVAVPIPMGMAVDPPPGADLSTDAAVPLASRADAPTAVTDWGALVSSPDAVPLAEPAAAPAAPPPRRSKGVAIAAGLLALAALVAGGVWVIIKDKDGKEVARIEVPDGGSVEVKDNRPKTERKKGNLTDADKIRKAAETLNPHFRLWVETTDRKVAHVEPTQLLPAGEFRILRVYPVKDRPAPRDIFFAALAALPDLGGIEDDCSGLKLTADDLRRLAKMPFGPRMQAVGVHDLELTADVVEALRAFPALDALTCAAARAGDDPLTRLPQAAPKLGYLVLQDAASVGPKGLAALTGLKLETFSVSRTLKLDPEACRVFAKMPLQTLYLVDTNLDDRMLAELGAVTRLRDLRCTGTKVTADGVKKLAAALPQCQITWDGGVIQPAPVPSAPPFEVVRAGAKVGAFATLAEAVAATRQGDAVEVRGNGPIPTGNVPTVNGKDVTLRAAPGFRPRLVQPADFDRDKPWIVVGGGNLRITGLEWSGGGNEFWFYGLGGELEVRDCRLLKWEGFNGVLVCGGDKFTLTGSVVVGITTHVMLQINAAAEKGAVTISDCLLVSGRGNGLIEVHPKGQTVTLTGNTVVCPVGVQVGRKDAHNPNPGTLTVAAERNVFAASVVMTAPEGVPGVKWGGRGNVYAATQFAHEIPAQGEGTKVWAAEDWQKKWGAAETGARFEKPLIESFFAPVSEDVKAGRLDGIPGMARDLRKRFPDAGVDVDKLDPPSLFDKLRREDISPVDLANAGDGDPAKAPPELVAVFGDSRWAGWHGLATGGSSADGKRVAAAGYEGVARVWDAETGRCLRAVSAAGQTNALLSPDGKTLAVSESGPRLRLIDVDTGAVRHEFEQSSYSWLAFSDDGNRFAAAGGEGQKAVLRVWETATGKPAGLANLPEPWLGRFEVRFAPDGKSVAVGYGNDLLLYPADLKGAPKTFAAGGPVWGVAVSPDGKSVAATTFPADRPDVPLTVWDVATGAKTRTAALPGPDPGHRWAEIVFDADNVTIRNAGSYLYVRDGPKGQTKTDLAVGTPTRWRFGPGGRQLTGVRVYGGTGMWVLPGTGEVPPNLPQPRTWLNGVSVSPDGRFVGFGHSGNWVSVHDLSTRKANTWFIGASLYQGRPEFLPDGSVLVAGNDGPLRVDAATAEPRPYPAAGRPNAGLVAVSPDRARVAFWGPDYALYLQDADGGNTRPVAGKHDGPVFALAFSPDGLLLASTGEDKTVKLWDARTGAAVRSIPVPHVSGSAAFSPDGTTLAVGMGECNHPIEAGAVKLFDVKSGAERGEYKGHPGATLAVAYSPDGATLASVGFDRTVRLWDVKTGKSREIPLAPTPGTGYVLGLAYAPDGRHLLTANGTGTVYVLRVK